MTFIIGIAGNHTFNELDTETVTLSYTPDGFVKGVQAANALPVILPVSTPDLAAAYVDQIDGLLLAGGQDVSPLLYDEEPHVQLGRTYPLRDAFELALIKEAYRQHKPILAICRGMQLLNVALGGTLYQDIASQYDDHSVLHVQSTNPTYPTHTVQIAAGSVMSQLLGSKASVNSYHHQAIKQLAEPFVAVAWSNDGIIEAFESKDHSQSVVAVQWHPETMLAYSNTMQCIFNNFVARIKQTQSTN